MKKSIYIMALLAMICGKTLSSPFLSPENNTLTGKITDLKTGEPIAGATIYFPDLKAGASSDGQGNYSIKNLPSATLTAHVNFLGYKLISQRIDLSTTTVKNFEMEEAVAELHEIVVTGLSEGSEKNRTATPITTLSAIELTQIAASNIIDAVATKPGISQVTTGVGISKPVIRGLGYNRVVVVNDGIRQEGQQWGDEHGIEVDEFSVNKIEILKGPASLSYGSDAMAGVIHLITAPTLPEGKTQATLLANYQTNNGMMAYSGNVAFNHKGLIGDIRFSNKSAHAYRNKYDGYVLNSGFTGNTLSGILGINRSWGYSHLHVSAYHLTPSIIEGERDSSTGKFVKPVAVNDSIADVEIASPEDMKTYDQLVPYQKIHHYKAVLNNSFILGKTNLKVIAGWQQNRRQEFGDVLQPDTYGLYFLMNTFNYDAKLSRRLKNNTDVSAGINGMYQQSQNKGSEFLVPEYNLFDMGIFITAKRNFGKLDLSGGVRLDSRSEKGKSLFIDEEGKETSANTAGALSQFSAFSSTFSGMSGSLGTTWQFTESVYTKLNVSRGFRAPNIAELGANGEHEGTGRYEIGDSKLKPENSWQADYAVGITTPHLTAEANLFYNVIDNYIFTSKLTSVFGGDSISNDVPVYKYTSGNAVLAGGEISVDVHPHPLDWLHFENSFSYVSGIQKNQPDNMKYLPLIPAPKFSSKLKATAKKMGTCFKNVYLETGIDHTFEQNNFFAANGTETRTPAYTLVNVGIGGDVVMNNKTLFSVYLSANNITDVAYQNHLSRLKYAEENYVTGRRGVFNMGRNVSFKVIVLFDFTKKKSG